MFQWKMSLLALRMQDQRLFFFVCICVSWQCCRRVRFFRRDAVTGRYVFPQQPAQLHHWVGVFYFGDEGKAVGGRERLNIWFNICIVCLSANAMYQLLPGSCFITYQSLRFLPPYIFHKDVLCNWFYSVCVCTRRANNKPQCCACHVEFFFRNMKKMNYKAWALLPAGYFHS